MFYKHNLLSVFRNSSKRIACAHYIESYVYMHCVYLFLKAFSACTVIHNSHVPPHQSLKPSIVLLKEVWKVWLRIFLYFEVMATWTWEFSLKAKVHEGDRQVENAKKPKERGEEKKNKRKAKRENEKIKWKNIKTGNSGTGKDVSDTINVII